MTRFYLKLGKISADIYKIGQYMFGMGFFEIFLIAIIAIIALGPEKLPTAMIEVAKFLKKFKSGVEDAKSSLDNELNIAEMKEEANKFKAQIEDAKSTVSINNVDLGMDNILNDDEPSSKSEVKKEKKLTVEEETIKRSKEIKNEKPAKKSTKADKFKVSSNDEENN